MTQNHTLETSGDGVGFTPGQLKLLRDAVWALDHAKRLRGNFRVFDGRKWPAINKLKLAGLLTVEDYDGRGYHDVITLRATEKAREVLAKALGSDPQPIPIEGGDGSSNASLRPTPKSADTEAEPSAAWRTDLARGVRLIAKHASGTVSLQGELLDFTTLLEIAARELEPPQ